MESLGLHDLIKKHYEQIELFYYHNRRELPRPKTGFLSVIAWSLAYLLVIAVCIMLNVAVNQPLYYEIPISIVVYALVSECLLRLIGIKVVECYQHYAKEETRRNCLCIPSCSEYAILCLKKYELIRALLKIRKRLYVTCVGSEYIIDNP